MALLDALDTSRLKVALFDMGGVVVEIHPHRVFECWSEATGLPPSHFSRRWQNDSSMASYETGKISFNKYVEFMEGKLEARMSLANWTYGWNALVGECYDTVFEQVGLLAQELPVYCLTNSNPEHESVWAHKYREQLSVFKEIFNSSTIGLRKPDLEVYEYVLKQIGVKPEECFFIDDLRSNVEAARSLGVEAFQTPGPNTTRDAIAELLSRVHKGTA